MCNNPANAFEKQSRATLRLSAVAVLAAWALIPANAGESPELESHQGEISVVGGGVSIFTVRGGSTDAPPDEMGCPPWAKTGNRRYVWQVEWTEVCDDVKMPTDPGDGAVTVQDMIVVSDSVPGVISISVGLQEEWRDSGEEPRTIYWPEASASEE